MEEFVLRQQMMSKLLTIPNLQSDTTVSDTSNNANNNLIKFKDNENHIDSLLRDTTCVKVIFDAKQSDFVKIMLPNNQMADSDLTTREQQIEIDKCIESFTGGKNSIEWSMIGIENAMDVIRALEMYKESNKTYFSKIIGECITGNTCMTDNEIILYLDGNKMSKVHSEWQNELYDDFKKSHVFHRYESVIINRKCSNSNQNKDKVEDKKGNSNNNKKKTKTNKRNENTKANKIEKRNNSVDEILDTWEIECKKIRNELEKRKLENCKCLDATFGILIEIENMELNLERNFSKHSQKNIFILNGNERAGNLNIDLKQDILNVKNRIKLIQVNLLNDEIAIDERLKNKSDNNVCENVLNQQQIESAMMIDHSLTTDTIAAECDSRIFQYIQNLNTMKIQFKNNMCQYHQNTDEVDEQLFIFNSTILNMEWIFFTKFVNNMLAYGLHCSDCNDSRTTISETNKTTEEYLASKSVADGTTLCKSEINQLLDILTQHTNVDLLYSTSAIGTGESSTNKNNSIKCDTSNENISYLINIVATSSIKSNNVNNTDGNNNLK